MVEPGGNVGRRPQRDQHHSPGLLERDHELALLEAALARAGAGSGRLLVVDGPGGSARHRLCRPRQCLRARPALPFWPLVGPEFEQGFAFGIVRQLLEPAVAGTYPLAQRQSLPRAASRAITALELIQGAGDAAAAEIGDATLLGTSRENAAMIVPRPLLADREPRGGRSLVALHRRCAWCDSPSAASFLSCLSVSRISRSRSCWPLRPTRRGTALAGSPRSLPQRVEI
jgi:hypothetical protein